MLKHTAPTLAGVTAPTTTATVSQRPLRPLAIAASALTGAGDVGSAAGQHPPAPPRTPQPVSLQPLQLLQTGTPQTLTGGGGGGPVVSPPPPKIANGGVPRPLNVNTTHSSTTQLCHHREPSHQYQNTLPVHLHHHHHHQQHSLNSHQKTLSGSTSLYHQPHQNQNSNQSSSYQQAQQSAQNNPLPPPSALSTDSQLQHHNSGTTSCLPRPLSTTNGVREALTSLGLLCLVSLLLALLSLIFLLKISPGGRDLLLQPAVPVSQTASQAASSTILSEDYVVVYDVTLALCALSLSLNLCCLLVCAVQFLFAVKLVRNTTSSGSRGNKYLQKSSASRVCAVGGFFVSIPVFLTGIILYTFTQFHSTPAIVTSVLIGVGILFCGGAMVHNVFVWQREKTISVRHSVLQAAAAAAAAASATQQQLGQLNATIGSGGGHHGQQLLDRSQLQQAGNQTPHASVQHAQQHSASVQSLTATLAAQKDHNSGAMYLNHSHPMMLNQSISHSLANTSQHTPITPNSHVSHLSFNQHAPYMPSSYLRPATSTPPTPKNTSAVLLQTPGGGGGSGAQREASGSISPPAGGNSATGLDMSSAATVSPHELSTLV